MRLHRAVSHWNTPDQVCTIFAMSQLRGALRSAAEADAWRRRDPAAPRPRQKHAPNRCALAIRGTPQTVVVASNTCGMDYFSRRTAVHRCAAYDGKAAAVDCTVKAPKLEKQDVASTGRGGMAETEGFEPSIHLSMYDDLANRCLQPLGHISANQKRSIPIEGHLTHCKNKASISVAGTHIGSTFPQFACYMGHPHIADQDMSGDKALKNDHTPRKGSRCWDNLLGITV